MISSLLAIILALGPQEYQESPILGTVTVHEDWEYITVYKCYGKLNTTRVYFWRYDSFNTLQPYDSIYIHTDDWVGRQVKYHVTDKHVFSFNDGMIYQDTGQNDGSYVRYHVFRVNSTDNYEYIEIDTNLYDVDWPTKRQGIGGFKPAEIPK
jgi:hypothetical protein